MKLLVTPLLMSIALVAAVAGCTSAPAAASPTVVGNATTALPVVAAGLAVPTPAAAAPYPYPPPNPTPQRTMTPRPTVPPLLTLAPTPTRTPLPSYGANDPADEAAIQTVIERSLRLRGIAARTFDTSQFDTVYINDPRIPLAWDQAWFIANNRALVRGRMPEMSDIPGILDVWRLEFALWQLGAERWYLREQGIRLDPADGPIGPLPRMDPPYETPVRYDSILISGDHAEVVLDDGPALYRLFLRKTPQGWRINGERVLDVHW